MKGQRKYKESSLIFYLFLLFFASGCTSENRQKGYFLVNYAYLNDGLTNMLLCKIEDYNPKKNITENLRGVNEMQCIGIGYSAEDENYKYIRQLKEINKRNRFEFILCKVDFQFTDTSNLSDFFYTQDISTIDSFAINCNYYILSSIRDKVIFHHFEPIKDVIVK
jgi:hypothetical protein